MFHTDSNKSHMWNILPFKYVFVSFLICGKKEGNLEACLCVHLQSRAQANNIQIFLLSLECKLQKLMFLRNMNKIFGSSCTCNCTCDNTVKIWVLLALLFLEPTKSYIEIFTVLLVWSERCLFLWDQSQLGLYWIVPRNGGGPCNFAIHKSPAKTESLGFAPNPAVCFVRDLAKFLRVEWIHWNMMFCLRFPSQLKVAICVAHWDTSENPVFDCHTQVWHNIWPKMSGNDPPKFTQKKTPDKLW